MSEHADPGEMIERAMWLRPMAEFGEELTHIPQLSGLHHGLGAAGKALAPLGIVGGGMKIAHADDPGDVLAGVAEIGSGAIGTLGAAGAITGSPALLAAAQSLGPIGAVLSAFGFGHTVGTLLDDQFGISDNAAGVDRSGLDEYYRGQAGVENQEQRGVGGIARAERYQRNNDPVGYYTEQTRREVLKASAHYAD